MPEETPSEAPSHRIALNASSLVAILALVAGLLVLVDLVLQITKFVTGHERLYGLVFFFNLDEERNAPSYFSGLIIILATLLLALIATLKRKERAPYAIAWAVLCVGFLYMAGDELLEWHEHLGQWIRAMIGPAKLGLFRHTWVVGGIPLIAVLGIGFWKFLRHLPGRVRFRFLFSACVYLGGAIGVEMIGGWYEEQYGRDLGYNLLAAVEESLEMAGMILFIRALLLYIRENYDEVRLRIR